MSKSNNLSNVAHDLNTLLAARKVFVRWLAESKDPKDYQAIEFMEIQIDDLVWDVEEQLLKLREVTPHPDITATFDGEILERLIDKRNDNDKRIRKADSSDNCAVWLAEDDAINSELETLLLAAIAELEHDQ
ncbi:hypothetical protein J2I47_25630 [Fibrella sp. HMF5335]|uniref:Uncharacterized protein n=1 Tax=Fibrella rubiginis TaxID=2817060 RepID=A0A939K457_9BACT|nr:hypothetical protein [Fibrella rubiginis]MBO0939952.1 hypothetical protein [Fibrella rubiginis]